MVVILMVIHTGGTLVIEVMIGEMAEFVAEVVIGAQRVTSADGGGVRVRVRVQITAGAMGVVPVESEAGVGVEVEIATARGIDAAGGDVSQGGYKRGG